METLKQLWQKWLGLSRVAGNVLGHIVLTVFYFTLMLPFSLGVTLFGDPLQVKQIQSGHWRDRQPLSGDMEEAHRQF